MITEEEILLDENGNPITGNSESDDETTTPKASKVTDKSIKSVEPKKKHKATEQQVNLDNL